METVVDISNLADVCLQIAYEKANKDLQKNMVFPHIKMRMKIGKSRSLLSLEWENWEGKS